MFYFPISWICFHNILEPTSTHHVFPNEKNYPHEPYDFIICLVVWLPQGFVTGGKGTGHNFWINNIAQGHKINWSESNGTKMADKTRPWSSVSKWNDTPRDAWESSKALLKDQGVGGSPNSRNLHAFPKIVGIILPLNSIWNYPVYKH